MICSVYSTWLFSLYLDFLCSWGGIYLSFLLHWNSTLEILWTTRLLEFPLQLSWNDSQLLRSSQPICHHIRGYLPFFFCCTGILPFKFLWPTRLVEFQLQLSWSTSNLLRPSQPICHHFCWSWSKYLLTIATQLKTKLKVK